MEIIQLFNEIKNIIENYPELVEGIVKINGFRVFISADHREKLIIRELDYVWGTDCVDFIYLNGKLYTYEDLQEYAVIYR